MTETKYGCKKNFTDIGVIVSNLGTPEAPTKKALRPYLKQFLSDRRVIEINPILWWIILNGIVLNLRPAKSAKAYASIWTDEGSPLLVTTKKQAKDIVAEKVSAIGMPFVTERWPGGMLTNFVTIRKAVRKMSNIEKM